MKNIIIIVLKIVVLISIVLKVFMGILMLGSSHIVPQKTFISILITILVSVLVFVSLLYIGRKINESNEQV